MRVSLVAILVALSLVVTSGIVLAAPPTPHPQNPRAEEVTSGNPSANAQIKQKDEKDKEEIDQDSNSKGKRRGAAGEIAGVRDGGFDLTTNWGESISVKFVGAGSGPVRGKSSGIWMKGKEVTLDSLAAGSRVNVHGTWNGEVLEAKLIHVIPSNPSVSHVVGTVKEISDTSITVTRDGSDFTFAITSDTEKEPEGATIEVGDSVTVVATKGENPEAKGIVVHKSQS